MNALDLRELIQDDIICAMAGWSHGGDSMTLSVLWLVGVMVVIVFLPNT
jgi:hypothetical protein